MMKGLLNLSYIALVLIFVLSACGNRNITAEDVQEALQQQGVEVAAINVAITEQDKGSSLQLNGMHPEAFELSLPAADMAHREYLFVYAYSSEEESKSARQSGGISSLRMSDLHANVIQKNNVVVIYWSHNKENPLMRKQYANAMNEL